MNVLCFNWTKKYHKALQKNDVLIKKAYLLKTIFYVGFNEAGCNSIHLGSCPSFLTGAHFNRKALVHVHI